MEIMSLGNIRRKYLNMEIANLKYLKVWPGNTKFEIMVKSALDSIPFEFETFDHEIAVCLAKELNIAIFGDKEDEYELDAPINNSFVEVILFNDKIAAAIGGQDQYCGRGDVYYNYGLAELYSISKDVKQDDIIDFFGWYKNILDKASEVYSKTKVEKVIKSTNEDLLKKKEAIIEYIMNELSLNYEEVKLILES